MNYIAKTAGTRIILTLAKYKHLVPVPEGHICLAIDEIMERPDDDHRKEGEQRWTDPGLRECVHRRDHAGPGQEGSEDGQ